MKTQLNVRNMVCIINIVTVTVKEYNMEVVIYTAYKTKTLEVNYPRSNVQYVLRHPTLHITESWTDFVENNDILLTVDMINTLLSKNTVQVGSYYYILHENYELYSEDGSRIQHLYIRILLVDDKNEQVILSSAYATDICSAVNNDFYKSLSDVSNKLVTRNKDYDELWESRRKLKLEKLTLEHKLKSMKVRIITLLSSVLLATLFYCTIFKK